MFQGKFKKALFDKTVTNTVPDTEFFLTYKQYLSKCHTDKTQCEDLYRQFKDLYTHLYDNTISYKSTSTYWIPDPYEDKKEILVFCPSNINITKIEEEQRESLNVMHEKIGEDVEVVMDFSKLTWKQVSRLLQHSSHDSLKNGARLWKTIPHKIKKIFIIKPNISGWSQIFSIAKFWMSEKIKSRIVVCDSWIVFYELKK